VCVSCHAMQPSHERWRPIPNPCTTRANCLSCWYVAFHRLPLCLLFVVVSTVATNQQESGVFLAWCGVLWCACRFTVVLVFRPFHCCTCRASSWTMLCLHWLTTPCHIALRNSEPSAADEGRRYHGDCP